MDHSPTFPPEPRVEAADISGRDREKPPGFEILSGFAYEQIRSSEMLNSIPHSDNIDFATQIDLKIVTPGRIHSELLNGMLNGFLRNIDSSGATYVSLYLAQEKTISAADL